MHQNNSGASDHAQKILWLNIAESNSGAAPAKETAPAGAGLEPSYIQAICAGLGAQHGSITTIPKGSSKAKENGPSRGRAEAV
jgi:hypothetical protein